MEAESTAAELLAELETEMAAVGGRLHRAASLTDARDLARELVDGGTVAAWPDEALHGIFAPEAAAPADAADVSLIVADVGIAGTGQIGFVHRSGRSRSVGLLPERQIALLAAEDVVAEVAQAFARLFGRGACPGNVVFVAGPSRTADIEQRSIRGVHAPRELDVVVYS
ncbi:MAG: LUD domain-containing protein [Actinomycetota bacterium]|nr:LUD domain-containing protein [Actinomycetota bacterium]